MNANASLYAFSVRSGVPTAIYVAQAAQMGVPPGVVFTVTVEMLLWTVAAMTLRGAFRTLRRVFSS